MKKLFKVLAAILIVVSAIKPNFALAESDFGISYEYVSFPNGGQMQVVRYKSDSSSTALDGEYTINEQDYSQYQGIVKLEEVSPYYNCFSYAFILDGAFAWSDIQEDYRVKGLATMDENDAYSILGPESYFYYATQCRGEGEDYNHSISDFSQVKTGDIVLYKKVKVLDGQADHFYNSSFVHAAIVKQKGATFEDTILISKWGQCATYQHGGTQCPYLEHGYYLASQGIDSAVQVGNPLPGETVYYVEISFVRFNNHVFNNVEKAYRGTVSENNQVVNTMYHKVKCQGCLTFKYEEHNMTNCSAIINKIGSLTVSLGHERECSACGYSITENHTYANNGTCIYCGYYSGNSMNSLDEEEAVQ